MSVLREATGIVAEVKGLASTGLRAVRTRLELLATELKEEKAWAVRFLVVGVAALYLFTFGLLLAIFALVVWASEENRPAILAGFATLFVAAGIGGMAYVFAASRRRSPIFGETIAVLKGDEKALQANLGATGD
jgi:uncharacterized membrane protein YqjE